MSVTVSGRTITNQALEATGTPTALNVLDALTSHVAVIGSDGCIVAVNRAWTTFARANGDEDLIGTGVGINYLDVLRHASGPFAEEAAAALDGITNIINGPQEEFTLEYPCFSPSQPRWFSMHATPLGDGSVVVSHTNITARKLAELHGEEALQREAAAHALTETAERILASVVQCVPVGILLVDLDGDLVLLNAAGQRILGLNEIEQVDVKRNMSEWGLYDPETREPLPRSRQPLWRALKGETVSATEYVTDRLGGGGAVRVQESASPLLEPNGSVTGAVAVFADVTEQRELDQQRENFISNAAHDLKGPLTAIKGFAQLLQRQLTQRNELSADRALEPLCHIDQTASRLATQIGELEDLASIRTGTPLRLSLSDTNVSVLVRRVLEQYQETNEDHEFRGDLPQYDVSAYWDASRMERVVHNVLSNAVKYSPVDTEIEVELRVDDQTIVIVVHDRGIGIPQPDLPRVFERYFRASNVVGRVPGTGIGLAGVRQIVRQHGGTIGVENRDGGGTTFTIHMPIHAQDAESPL